MFQDTLPEGMKAEYNAYVPAGEFDPYIMFEAPKASYGGKAMVCLKIELERGQFVEVPRVEEVVS
jgi:hypothetical protein